MTKKKTSKEKPTPQGQDPKITKISIPEPITYNVKELDDFLNFVFEGIEDDENVLVWKTGGVPGYPLSSPQELYNRLTRSKAPSKLYFGTSTVGADPDGNMRNQKALFKAFYVLVLDDIGTKVPFDKIPAAFTPTYKIETSKGNFQYGYVLDEPITVREEAETLVQLVYEGGFSDAGGRMANKLVRLPGGVNGKDRSQFKCRMSWLNEDKLWSPKEILDILDLGVTWDEVVNDSDAVIKSRAGKGVGVGAWSPIKSELGALNGVIDPVAEWLYENGHVKQETNEWLTVKCPWSDQHTDGSDVASYSPLGWGGPEFISQRTFHCFHEHCAAQKAPQFLQYVADSGGPNAARFEEAAHLISSYVFDKVLNGVWEVKGQHQPLFQPLDAWRNDIPNKIRVHLPGEKNPKLIPATTAFIQAPNRVTVQGQTYDPTTVNKIVADHHGKLHVNMYTQPDWGDGEHKGENVAQFQKFLNYLIPNPEAREYFLDWLAAKAQNMAFRGPAILMIAPEQGTGRTTLGNMVAKLFGKENVEKVPFERLAAGGGTYNDWIVKPIIITDETLALGDDQKKYAVYERLKELIDTTPEEVRVNPKYGKQRFQMTYSSFMLFSNHEDAMQVADNDRRIYVLNNAPHPAAPEYFIALHEWLDSTNWAQDVWRWLRKRNVDVGQLLKPPEDNKAKDDMIGKTKAPVDVAVAAALAAWPTKMLAAFQIKEVLNTFTHRLQLDDSKSVDKIYQHKLENNTFKVDLVAGKMRIGKQIVRIRFIKSKLEPGDEYWTTQPVEVSEAAQEITYELTPEQQADIVNAVVEALDLHDF